MVSKKSNMKPGFRAGLESSLMVGASVTGSGAGELLEGGGVNLDLNSRSGIGLEVVVAVESMSLKEKEQSRIRAVQMDNLRGLLGSGKLINSRRHI